MDREGRHKGGIMALVLNTIPVQDLKVDTDNEAEISKLKIKVTNQEVTLFNVYCPSDKELSLNTMELPESCGMGLGDFNSHSESWGYVESDSRGDEVEDWQIENNLLLTNEPDDPPTVYSRRWHTTSTPDLAFVTIDLCARTTRTVLKQLGGSDHKPIKLSINDYKPSPSGRLPRWNYRKANWDTFAAKTEIKEHTRSIHKEHTHTRRISRGTQTSVKWQINLMKLSKKLPRKPSRGNHERTTNPTGQMNLKT
jgi:hypothetical protein